ncbi:hypothetical protein PPNK14_43680 [Pectobacterium parmentieri]
MPPAPASGANVIQHNAALREMGRRGGPQRVTHIMSAPVE